MLAGKSVWHVNQDIGKCFSKDSIRGYYNNMTEKVTKMPGLLHDDRLPVLTIGGESVEMPVSIFQYGLGSYDLYLQTREDTYLKKFNQAVNWCLIHQDKEGRWNNFFYIYPDHPYGAMAQGEGASLLIRAFIQTGEDKYLHAAKRAIDFMLKPIEEGGTTEYSGGHVVFLEYTHCPVVMNGGVFAWWGVYDFVAVTNDTGKYKKILDQSCTDIVLSLPRFRNSFWSKYDLAGKIASPFYHNLHIAQMQAMFILTGNEVFHEYALKWERQQKNMFCKSMAFVIKALQKLIE